MYACVHHPTNTLTPAQHILLYAVPPPFREIAHRNVVPDVLFLFGVIISYDGHLCKCGCQCHISLLIVLSHTSTQSLSLPPSLTLSFPRARASAHAFFLSLARSCSSKVASAGLKADVEIGMRSRRRSTTALVRIRFRSHESRLRDRNAKAFRLLISSLCPSKKKKHRLRGVRLFSVLNRLLQLCVTGRRKQSHPSASYCRLHLYMSMCVFM